MLASSCLNSSDSPGQKRAYHTPHLSRDIVVCSGPVGQKELHAVSRGHGMKERTPMACAQPADASSAKRSRSIVRSISPANGTRRRRWGFASGFGRRHGTGPTTRPSAGAAITCWRGRAASPRRPTNRLLVCRKMLDQLPHKRNALVKLLKGNKLVGLMGLINRAGPTDHS